MGKKRTTDVSTEVVAENPTDIVLNFSEIESFSTRSQEIRKSLLTGKHTRRHTIRPANIVLSAVRDLQSDGGAFDYVDFKDSFIEQSSFLKASFDYGAVINCDFDDVEFNGCHFHNVSITGSSFRNVRFTDCSLDHMVIESCKFFNCKFVNCSTSNKLFDYCLLIDTIFTNTDLQIQTLIGSFGISKEGLVGCAIRTRSIDESFKRLSAHDIANYPVSTPIEAFKIQYFLGRERMLMGAPEFEATFEVSSWIGTAEIPLTFTNLLTLYMDFLVSLYENRALCMFPILKLHSLTGALIDSGGIPATAMTPIYGVHMSLARIVEAYLAVVIASVQASWRSMAVLVNGPLEAEYYRKNYPFLFVLDGISIKGLKKHNSPNEMLIYWHSVVNALPFVAIFFASRFKFEIGTYEGQLTRSLERSSDIKTASGKNLIPVKSLFQVSIGFDKEDRNLYGLKLKSIFPGNLLIELGLQLSIQKVLSTRTVLVKILTIGDRK